jgi:hypothetical protein
MLIRAKILVVQAKVELRFVVSLGFRADSAAPFSSHKMKIFIDESGSFSGFQTGSVGAVGALAVPDGKLAFIEKKYAKIRRRLPLFKGEVKGRLLNEMQVAEVVSLVARNAAIFEVSILDLGLHTAEGVAAYKNALLRGMLERVPRFNDEARPKIEALLVELAATPLNLFLQTIALFETLYRVVQYVPIYFAQRQPKELGTFAWVVDGKDPQKVTNWEKWWASYIIGALATKSKFHAVAMLEGADYSYYDKFRHVGQDGEDGTNLSLLLKDLRFSSDTEFGLELVDILTNAVRRAIIGNLGIEGWGGIVRTMIHRKEHYVALVRLDSVSQSPNNPSYASIINHFWSGGKPMLTRNNLRLADEGAV